jgi:hypothetical protein
VCGYLAINWNKLKHFQPEVRLAELTEQIKGGMKDTIELEIIILS